MKPKQPGKVRSEYRGLEGGTIRLHTKGAGTVMKLKSGSSGGVKRVELCELWSPIAFWIA